MAVNKSVKKAPRKSVTRAAAADKKFEGFSAEERAAMKAYARELKAAERLSKNRAAGEQDVLAAIAAMGQSDRTMAKRVHAIVEATAPDLWPKTWYGMPAYAKDGKVVCFFKPAEKFNSRYATFGFEEAANLDEGAMWPTSYALTKLTPADEKKLAALIKKAVR